MIKIALDGRLGNQLFQYVVCRSLSLRRGFNFCIPLPGDRYISNSTEGLHITDFFSIDSGIVDGNIINYYQENINIGRFDQSLFDISDFTLLSGFFQSEKYFIDFEPDIKKWLKIKTKTNALEILSKYNPESYCFIHLRGGDYKSINWLLPFSYYESAIKKIHSINHLLNFVVITDDRILANQYFPNFDCLSNDMMTDFEILKMAKYTIIANSSFSWWSAWLADDQITIAPDNWINYNRPELGTFPKDIKSYKFIHI